MAKTQISLPDEILYGVFLTLPIKSLTRFRCVSKPWNALISDHQFGKSHYLNQQTKDHVDEKFCVMSDIFHIITKQLLYTTIRGGAGRGFASNDEDVVITFEIPLMSSDFFAFKFVGSCDGLICAHCLYPSNFFVFNPTTRICKRTFFPNKNSTSDRFRFFGFGYDSSSDDYKIVNIVAFKTRSDVYEVWVYSMKNNSWKNIGYCPYKLNTHKGTYVNGSIHWVGDKSRDIAAFDLAMEKFKQVEIPEELRDAIKLGTLGLHKDCLCMHVVDYNEGTVVVWTMVEYGKRESWTKLVVFPFEYCYLLIFSSFFHVVAEGDKILMLYDDYLLCVDSQNGSIQADDVKDSGRFEVIKYKETMVSPLA